MDKIFYPNSLVVVGVSEKADNLSRNIVENLLRYGYSGELYLIGRQAGQIQGLPILTSVKELPAELDVAIILTPAQTVPELIDQLGALNIQYAVIETAGFSEFSEAGRLLEQEIGKTAEKWGMKIVGPNCVGIICMDHGINTVFVKMEKDEVQAGNVTLISQSGGVVLTIADFISASNLGLTKAVSVGNKLNLKEAEYLQYFQQDASTQTILMYLESIEEGRRLMEIADQGQKPVIVYKSNTSQASAEIARSHTAALSNDDNLVSAVFQQFGVTRVFSFREMINACKGFSLPPVRGNKLAVFSRSGGHGIVSVDLAHQFGFTLPSFPESLIHVAKPFFRVDVIDRQNPLDMGTVFNFDAYPVIIEETIKQTQPDAVLLIFNYRRETHPKAVEIANRLKELSQHYQTAIAICYFTEMDAVQALERELVFPIYAEVSDAIQSLAYAREFYRRKEVRAAYLADLKVRPHSAIAVVERILAQHPAHEIDIDAAMRICQAYQLPVAEYCLAENSAKAIQFAQRVGYPVAIKIAGSGAIHKTDVGGVALHLNNEHEIEQAIQKIEQNLLAHGIPGPSLYLVQKMYLGCKEIIIGGKQDASFGPVILCGLGGIYAEVFQDIQLKMAPIHLEEAREMLYNLKGFAYLSGVRGEKSVELEALAQILVRVAQLMVDFPTIVELDLNPVLANEDQAVLVDVRMIKQVS